MKRRVFAILLTLAMALSLTACGGSASSGSTNKAEAMAAPSAPAAPAPMAPAEMEDGMVSTGAAAGGAMDNGGPSGQKLIRTAHLEMESTAFEDAAAALEELTERLGGYYERGSIANYKSGARRAEYTVRVPAEKYEEFLTQAGALCHVTWQETSQDDISEAYYDTAGRLKTQQIKLERLQELLSKAELMEDIITIESAISETEWNIENLSGTLRHYDGKVDYATVYITMNEVYKLSNVEEVPDSFGSRLGAAFEDGILDFMDSMEDLAVSFAYSWMWWLLGAAVIVLIWKKKAIRLPKIRIGRRKKKDDDQE